MSFLNKNFDSKASLAKPVILVVVVAVLIGGIYSIFGSKKSDTPVENAEAPQAEVTEINPSGLDKDMTVANVEDVEKVIAKWIEANPKAVINSIVAMQKKAMEDQAKDAQKNISGKKDEIFDNKSSPQYAPSGYNVSIAEFFDYSCGYCKKAQATLEELIKSDPKVRIVYKEFPILGQASEDMSTIALAINIIDPSSYKKFHDALMRSNAHSKEEAMKIAKDVGVNPEKLEASLKKNKDKIAEIIKSNRELGSSIGINGTPGFVIGEELVPGAFEVQVLKDKVAAVRKK